MYDDASNDTTAEVARAGGVRVICGEINLGPSGARNRLLAEASGDLVHFHDADDDISPTFLSDLLPHAGSDHIVFGDYAVGNRHVRYNNDIPASGSWAEFFLHRHVPLDVMLIPRSILPNPAFDTGMKLAEDRLLNISLAMAGTAFRHVPVVAAKVNESATSTSRKDGVLVHLQHEIELYARLEPLASVAQRRLMGELLLGPACALVLAGNTRDANVALKLARRLGARKYQQGSRTVRMLVRLIGPSLAFRLMCWRLRLSGQA